MAKESMSSVSPRGLHGHPTPDRNPPSEDGESRGVGEQDTRRDGPMFFRDV